MKTRQEIQNEITRLNAENEHYQSIRQGLIQKHDWAFQNHDKLAEVNLNKIAALLWVLN